MYWILGIIGAFVVLNVIGLVFNVNPIYLIKSIFMNLFMMVIVIGLGNLIGHFAGSQKGGFVIGCLVFLFVCVSGIVNRTKTQTGSIEDFQRKRAHTEEDSKVDGWVGIVLLAALALSFVLGSMFGRN
ncbi:MAG: hypothetical protein IJV08_02910 [Bacteroidaceae bacterium]|nr:hypothetical protein [Bacteroidaceae bacterium]